MKPITFQFMEKPNRGELNYSNIEYCEKLNLTIDKLTKLPAIDSFNMETETFTRTTGETSDSDNDFRMDTATRTYTQLEATDSDSDIYNLKQLMGTQTLTKSSEVSDSDKEI